MGVTKVLRLFSFFALDDRRANGAALGLLYFSALTISYFLLVQPGLTYVAIWPNDVMALLNGANRVYQGQIPFLDFHSVLGPLVYYLPALGLHAGVEPGAIFAFNGVLVAAFLLLMAWLTMYRRFSLLVTVTTFIFLSLLIVVPMANGGRFSQISWGMFYNRHGWAALAIVLFHYVEPRKIQAHDKWIDAIVLSALVVFQLYNKITFGLVSAVFLLANLITSKYNRDVSVICIVVIIAIVTSVEIIFGFNVAYAQDIFYALEVGSVSRGGLRGIVNTIIHHAGILTACVGALLAVLAAGRRYVLDWLYVLCCIIASIMLLDQSGDRWGLQALIAVFVCCGELARRAEIDRESGGTGGRWPHHTGSLVCMFLALMFISKPVSARVAAWYSHYNAATRIKPLPGLPPALSGFIVPTKRRPTLQDIAGDDDALDLLAQFRLDTIDTLSPRQYFLTIVEGVELLRTTTYRDRTVFVFDVTDPFTFALNMRPTENGYPMLWAGTTLSRDIHPPAESIFSDVDYVMVPRLPYHQGQLDVMLDIYGDYLKSNYMELKRSPHWGLWGRKSK